jgi:1-acyl-sn-glycerol-3-phosphate acyltransferase
MSSYHQAVANVSSEVGQFMKETFTSIEMSGPELDPKALNTTPLMLVCTHRSHVDYFLLGNIFHNLGFNTLRFAAGDNLTKLPWIGPTFTSFGAFTVERDTGFNRHYVRDLCSKVVSMIENGETVLVFPEGGRSYSGSMLDIKTGILGASIISQANDINRDVHYIPAAISYESPPDLPWFSMQIKGKNWRKRSNMLPKRLLGNLFYFGADVCAFLPFLFARKFGRKYGAVYIDYGKPVSIRSIIDVLARKNENARDEFIAHRNAMHELSGIIHKQLYRLYRILPMHMVAFWLHKEERGTRTACMHQFIDIMAKLESAGRNTSQLALHSPEENIDIGIRQLKRMKAVSVKKDTVLIRNRSLIDYYAATIT